ncbi:MAG: peptide chain release factor N(5)-glutamine methyltransferase [Chloroflexi bacterium]|nr:peptide chain release factor N(5)-glutamine methyltransferase [Chloroflexota bacterium]
MSFTIERMIRKAAVRLRDAGVDSPRLDAELLMAHVLGRDRAYLLAHPEEPLSPEQLARFEELLARRAAREPLAYIIGKRWFYGLEFMVEPGALIPRPETELLVELALAWLAKRREREILRVADVGTGSGAIAVSLAVHAAAHVQIAALDASPEALRLARVNAQRHRGGAHPFCAERFAAGRGRAIRPHRGQSALHPHGRPGRPDARGAGL